ncbi:MAG: hypothetical protein M4D80_03720 [Myxococcota bacterium]|nr:hypothetical protein [Myxococcota bacterium]
MTRLTSIAFAVTLAAGGYAFAQSQAELAEKLNEEGKAFMYADKYTEASAKFRDAVARVPEAKYFYNLCASLFKEGKFGEALLNCNNASSSETASPQLKEQASKLALGIKEEGKRQGIDVEPQGGGQSPGDDPNLCTNTPNDPRCVKPDICQTNPQDPQCQAAPPPQQNYAVGKPPSQDILASGTPDNKYTWTLGVEVFGGGGKIGQKDVYGTAASGLRIKGDYLLNSAARLGAQGYFTYTHLGKGEEDVGMGLELDIVDFGAALYKHLCPPSTDRLCLTPLAGVHIAMMSPNGANDGVGSRVFEYAAIGARVELGAHYAFGSRYEHVLGVALGANLYSSVFSGPSDDDLENPTAAAVGLDKGGGAGYLSVGYTYRFNTPLGSSPFVTLQ